MMSDKTWTHTLSPGLVATLRKIRLAVKNKGENKIHLQRDLTLTHNEYCNAQKLRFFGLIAKYREQGEHIAGFWVLTHNGALFLSGQINMPKRVKTLDNQLIEKSEETCQIYDFYEREDSEYWQENFMPERIEHEKQLAFL